jgi:hypothetical protein
MRCDRLGSNVKAKSWRLVSTATLMPKQQVRAMKRRACVGRTRQLRSRSGIFEAFEPLVAPSGFAWVSVWGRPGQFQKPHSSRSPEVLPFSSPSPFVSINRALGSSLCAPMERDGDECERRIGSVGWFRGVRIDSSFRSLWVNGDRHAAIGRQRSGR